MSDTESQYLQSQHDSDSDEEYTINLMKAAYERAKAAKVGDTCCCPVCKASFVKRSYQQAFHVTECKDRYWNIVSLKRRYRAIMFGSTFLPGHNDLGQAPAGISFTKSQN